LVATLDLAGAGLSPLSSKDAAALLATVNKTLAARGTVVSSIRLGNVQVREGGTAMSSCLAKLPHLR
jgi:hypothetical protein